MQRNLILTGLVFLALAACTVDSTVTTVAGQGPPSYIPAAGDRPFSSAVQVGNLLFVAGHLGMDPDTGAAPEDPAAEAGFMLDAFAATLAKAGMTMDDLVQVQLFCSDVALYDTFNAVYRERFTGNFPARAFIGSGKLLRGARFEILGIAAR